LVEQELGQIRAAAYELARQETDDRVALLRDPEEHIWIVEERARRDRSQRRTHLATVVDVEVGVVAREQRQDRFVVAAELPDAHRAIIGYFSARTIRVM